LKQLRVEVSNSEVAKKHKIIEEIEALDLCDDEGTL